MSTDVVKSENEVKVWNSMSLDSIESYGSEIQLTISEQMSKMLHDTRCIDLEQTGKSLSDLSVETNAISKRMSIIEKLPSLFKVSKWLARYDNIENRITSLETGITSEKERLNTVLNGLHESLQFMRERLNDLETCQSELYKMVDYFQSEGADDDGLKLQAASNRLKLITTTIAVVKQECAKTVLIIKENKEVSAQLAEASDNLIPLFKVMMLNVLGAKTNAEAMQLKKNLSKVANEVVVKNAKQIEATAEDLIRGRQEPLIKAETIKEANSVLQSAIEKVQQSASVEVQTNLESVAELQNSIERINSLSLISLKVDSIENE